MKRYICLAVILLSGTLTVFTFRKFVSVWSKEDGPLSLGSSYEQLTLDDFTFQYPAHREKLHRMQEIASRIAEESWEHREWYRLQNAIVYHAWWASLPNQINDLGHLDYGRDLTKLASSFHRIVLNARNEKKRNKPREISAVGVEAGWIPEPPGWSGAIHYYDPRDSSETVLPRMKFFYNYRTKDKFTDGVRSYEELRLFHVERTYGDTLYGIGVSGSVKYPETDSEIIQVLKTPEVFRDFCLKQLESLEKNVREQIPNGRGISYQYYTRDLFSSHRKHQIQFVSMRPQPPRSERELTKEEKQELVSEAVSLIERRRDVITENFYEIHAAIEKAFPLVEFLKPKERMSWRR